MDAHEQRLSQIEEVLTELQQSQKQVASSIALEEHKPAIHLPKTIKLLFIALLIIASVIAGIRLFTGSIDQKKSINFVEGVKQLSTLATAKASIKVVINQEDNKIFGKNIGVNLPGTKRELLIVVPATVLAGVDLQGIQEKDMNIDEKRKKLEIVLPHATLIQDPAIQMDNIVTYSNEGMFRGDVKWDEGFDLAGEAKQKIIKETAEIGLLATAEKNAEKVLQEFFSQLGYSVKVSFK